MADLLNIESSKAVFTRQEVADFLDVNPKTVSREIARGKLSCIHVGRSIRITRQHIAAYIASQEVCDEHK